MMNETPRACVCASLTVLYILGLVFGVGLWVKVCVPSLSLYAFYEAAKAHYFEPEESVGTLILFATGSANAQPEKMAPKVVIL